MSEDLESLLINLPKPLILIEQDTNKVVLGNKELCKLLSLDDYTNKELIQERIN